MGRTAPPTARVQHALPGRFRLRLPALAREPARLEQIGRQLEALADVTAVRARPQTFSLLVLHRGPRDAILRCAEERGLLREVARADEPPPGRSALPAVAALLRDHAARAVRAVDPSLEHLVDRRPTAVGPVVLALAALALYRLSGGHVLPSATSLAGEAFQLVRRVALTRGEAAASEA